ncbi:MAG: hypothetical protein CMM15_13350 [Rhodospirillaceae bacterium]|nr:hypothetical protein [Rhodospirillaceae bacterium]|tara:strand:- start:2521 stop:3357 length:837 start_codon:yes stop_codon:yes gene_type:complete
MHSLLSPSDKKALGDNIPERDTRVEITQQQLEELKKELNVDIRSYQVDRYYSDPMQVGQKTALVSFVPSAGAKPDKDNIYGMMKVRGVYESELDANNRAEFLIKNVDSYHEIFHCHVGRPFPITDNNRYAHYVQKIDIKNKTTEVISEDIINKRREEKNEVEQIKEREEQLLKASKQAEKGLPVDEYDEYITLNVKRAQLLWTYRESMKKFNEMRKGYESAVGRIKELDTAFPNYKHDYMEKYMQARRDSGIPDDQESFVKFMSLDIDTTWDEVETMD